MTTAWNPSDEVNTTLSGGNLVATFSSGSGVRSVDSVTTEKVYWEITYTTKINAGTGICLSTSSFTGINAVSDHSAAWVTNGGIVFNNGSFTSALDGTFTSNGWILCVALNATTGKIWFRQSGQNWNASGTADPATGTGGYSITSWATAGSSNLYAVGIGGSGSGVLTANFGASAFSGSVPSGFASGFVPGGGGGGIGQLFRRSFSTLGTRIGSRQAG